MWGVSGLTAPMGKATVLCTALLLHASTPSHCIMVAWVLSVQSVNLQA